tara:strand:+ start:398 stop:580 length:183 start_codon:yes stop_codon:yes gene_type:complete
MTSKERLEQLVKQYQEVSQQASEAITLKTKLEGAIELTQQVIKEDEEAAKPKETDKKEKK